MNRFKRFAAFAALLLVGSAFAQAENKAEWLIQYEAATKAAAETKKPLLVLFTNSTTCAPCKILKRDVLSTDEFAKYAGEKLILLQVDYAPYFDKEKKKELAQIEQEQGIPKELWMKGRGPWPWMFVLAPDGKEMFSGKAYEAPRATPATFIAFLESLK